MHLLFKKILTILLLFSCIQPEAQVLNWDHINLAGAEAKILETTGAQPEQNKQLIIRSFDTKEGKINVFLPPLSSAVTLSGTVYLEPGGKDSSRNLVALQSYSLALDELVIPVQRGPFQVLLPADPLPRKITLQLKNSSGQLIKSEQIPLTNPSATNNAFIMPSYIVSGDPIIIRGNFDGNLNNTSVRITGEKVELLAESPSQLFFTSTANHTGKSTIECTENGITQTSAANILKLELNADKTDLRRGQQTMIHLKLSGLEGLVENVPLTIQNTSSSVITLEGGNTQQITLVPRNDAPSGVWQISRTIQSLRNGSFSVSVNVSPSFTTKQ